MPSMTRGPGPAEIGRAVEREDLAVAHGRQVLEPLRSGRAACSPLVGGPARRRSRTGSSIELLRVDVANALPGRLAAPARPSRPSRSQPPARRTCSGTQWPDANGGSSHSRQTTRRAAMPSSRRSRTRFSMRASRSRSISMRPTASSSASAIAPTVEMVLRMPSIDVGSRLTTVVSRVELPDRVGDLAVAHRADVHSSWVRIRSGSRRRERVQVEAVDRAAAVDRRGDTVVDLAAAGIGGAAHVGRSHRDRRRPRPGSRTRGCGRRARRPDRGRRRSPSPRAAARRCACTRRSSRHPADRRRLRSGQGSASLRAWRLRRRSRHPHRRRHPGCRRRGRLEALRLARTWSRTSPSTFGPARCSASSGPTAPARRRRCG